MKSEPENNMKRHMIDEANGAMRTTRLLRRSILTYVLISCCVGLAASAEAAQTKSLVEGDTAFALELYARLSGTPGNLFFSPYSISTCLAMTYAGARGDTETQMGQVLHISKGRRPMHSSFGILQRQLNEAQKQKGIQLDIANALWTQKGEPFLPAFLKIANDDYQANVNQADFKTSAGAVTREINRWVAQKTKDKIQDILPPGSVDDLTQLVLANAIYFRGSWASRFEKAATSAQPFHLSENGQAEVPLMYHVADASYVENNELQAVELAYSGDELSMVILLPRQIDALGQMERQLSPAFLARLLAQMKKQNVEVFLPKFKLESGFNLNDTLAKMGMPDAFIRPKADFSGLNGTKGDLCISGVFHKAWAEVNEEGTEAAAATGVAVAARGLTERLRPPPVFRADHPFIFLIRDTRSGSLLFVGRLADPRV
jgi:serpin B